MVDSRSWSASTLNHQPSTIDGCAGSLQRLCRDGFYFDELLFFGVIMPIRALAQLCRFADWLIVDALILGSLARLPAYVVRWGNPLRSGPVQLWVLGLGAFTAGLLAVALAMSDALHGS
jgi:hypothetical protein